MEGRETVSTENVEKRLHRLRRSELLEMLLEIEKENEELAEENARLKEQLRVREVELEDVGTLADASVKISKLFDSAQKAVDFYLDSVRKVCVRQMSESREKVAETKRLCLILANKTEKLCEKNGGVKVEPPLAEKVEGWFQEIEGYKP